MPRGYKSLRQRLGLVKVDIPAKAAEIVDRRVGPLIEHAEEHLSLRTIEHVVQTIARDCYIQGLIDGQGLPKIDTEAEIDHGTASGRSEDYFG